MGPERAALGFADAGGGASARGHKGPVNAAVFSADGATVYTASYDGTIGAYDRATGEAKAPVYQHGWGVNVLARLPGTEQLVFGSLNGDAGVVDAAGTGVVRALPGHARPVLAIAVLDKPGLIATGGGDGVVRVLRVGDGALLEEHSRRSARSGR